LTKHRSPSRARYDAAHVTVTIHVTIETNEHLNALQALSGKSRGQLASEGLGLLRANYDAVYARGLEAGRQQGQAEAEHRGQVEGRRSAGIVDAECLDCGGVLVARAGEDPPAVNGAKCDEGWLHYDCHGKRVSSEYMVAMTRPDGRVVIKMPGESWESGTCQAR